jgi:hypothetical protein
MEIVDCGAFQQPLLIALIAAFPVSPAHGTPKRSRRGTPIESSTGQKGFLRSGPQVHDLTGREIRVRGGQPGIPFDAAECWSIGVSHRLVQGSCTSST